MADWARLSWESKGCVCNNFLQHSQEDEWASHNTLVTRVLTASPQSNSTVLFIINIMSVERITDALNFFSIYKPNNTKVKWFSEYYPRSEVVILGGSGHVSCPWHFSHSSCETPFLSHKLHSASQVVKKINLKIKNDSNICQINLKSSFHLVACNVNNDFKLVFETSS